MNRTPSEQVPAHHRYAPLAFALAAPVVAALVAMAGRWGQGDPRAAFVSVVTTWGVAGWPALVYLGASLGFGRLLRPLLRSLEWTRAIEPALGMAIILLLSNAGATLGLFGGRAGIWIAWALLAPGLYGALLFFREATVPANDGRSPWRWMAYLGAAFIIAAACSPPGWLFGSEGGGYDSLSYHLQLPQEWLQAGRLAPLRHNVFSYFPSFVESSFVHLGAISGAPRAPDTLGLSGLIAGDGWRLLSCQMLHALMTVECAWLLGRLVRALAVRVNAGQSAAEWAVAAARLAFLLTPWTVVVGALSYNEMPLLMFVIAALLVLIEAPEHDGRGALIGVMMGLLVGGAVGAKPTALLFVVVPLALCAAWRFAPRRWLGIAAPCAVTSLLVLSPWLVRNALDGPNPVFPLAMKVLGTNHWNAEQAERFAAAVRFEGTLVDRLRLIFLVDKTDPSGPRHRGLMHPQWLWLWFALPVSLAMVWSGPVRRFGALLAVFLGVQLIAWLFATHIQARFLLPCVPVLLALVALAFMRLPRAACCAIVALLAARAYPAYLWYSAERDGEPNRFTELGPGFFSGHAQADAMRTLASREDRARLVANSPPAAGANVVGLRAVYLLGDATPLYWSGARYNTTWDPWPFGEAIDSSRSEDPWAWNDALRAKGISHVFVNTSELSRLARSGLLDPRVTPERVKKWLETCTDAAGAWPEVGCYLVELRDRTNQGTR